MNISTLDALTFDKLVPSESKYLKKEDLADFEDGAIVTIKGFKYESIQTGDDAAEDKVICYFKEFDKGMVLNKTNASLIPICTGARTAGEARGKQLVLYVDPTVSYGGKIVGGLRLKKVPGAPKAPRAVARPPEREPGSDDDLGEIPFNDEI